MTHRDLVEIIVSSLVGFIVGYASCLLGKHAGQRRVISLKWVGDGRRFAGIMILVLLVVSLVGYWQTAAANTRLAACVAAEAKRTNEAIAARSQASQAQQQAVKDGNAAQRAFLATAYEPGVTSEQKAAAYRQYLIALDKVDASLDHLRTTQQAFPLGTDGCT